VSVEELVASAVVAACGVGSVIGQFISPANVVYVSVQATAVAREMRRRSFMVILLRKV
jgi:L-lactate permease